MKTKFLWIALVLGVNLCGCSDNTGALGWDMMPDEDGLFVDSKSFDVATRSVMAGPVFAKTSTGYIGKYTDPDFGYFESGFLTQLNCIDDLRFPALYDRETKTGLMAADSVHMAELIIYYNGFFGDSLNACHLSAYELDKVLDKNHYTNIVPEDYYDSQSGFLGGKAYSAVDLSFPTSVRWASGYVPYVRMPLPKEIGDRIYKANREHPEYFDDADAFIDNVFKGLYLKCDAGDGTVIYVNQVLLNVVVPCFALDSLNNILEDVNGNDSVEYRSRSFVSTKEVIQANRFTNSNKLQDKVAETQWTYVKSPAGIFTEVTLPIQEIADELASDTLNAVRFAVNNYAKPTVSTTTYGMSAPSNLLLVRKKDVDKFFENNLICDNITSFYATQNATATNQYVFNNLSRLISYCIREKEEARKAAEKAGTLWDEAQWKAETEWDKMLLVPIVVSMDTNGNILRIENDLAPKYVKLKGGDTKLSVDVSYTSFTN
ncbi:MAG: DUF4270 domain-containing protein [Prevotellaceae bacterium]|jgi:hypothetical protein|nr:DUF4270 domain-containing protein [Prevotellaceae bacterium]